MKFPIRGVTVGKSLDTSGAEAVLTPSVLAQIEAKFDLIELDIIDLQTDKSDVGHLHDDRYYTETEMNVLLSNKAPAIHNHDDLYYTLGEVDDFLLLKADKTYVDSQDLLKADKTYTDTQLATKVPYVNVNEVLLGDVNLIDESKSMKDLWSYWYNITSASRLYGGKITANPNGTINIEAGGGLSKPIDVPVSGVGCDIECAPPTLNDGQGSKVSFVTWNEVLSLPLVDNAYNYIYYEGSTNSIKATTNFYAVSFTRDFTFNEETEIGLDVEPDNDTKFYLRKWENETWVEGALEIPQVEEVVEVSLEDRVVTIEETLEVLFT